MLIRALVLPSFLYTWTAVKTNQDGQLIKDITASLRGDQPQPSPLGAFPKTRHPGSKDLSSTQPALTRSKARAGRVVKVVNPSVTKAATLLRTRPQIRATKPKGSRSISNLFDLGTNTGRFDASVVSKKIFSTPTSPKTLPLDKTSSSLFGKGSDPSSGVSPGRRMRATPFFFTPFSDDVNGLTSSDDELSKEAEVPTTRMAVSTKVGGESKDGNTVVADTGMNNPNQRRTTFLIRRAPESRTLRNSPGEWKKVLTTERKRRKTTTSKTLLQLPSAIRIRTTADVTSERTPTPQDKTHSVPTRLRHTRTVLYPGKKLGNFSHGISQMEPGNATSNPPITSSK